MTPSSPDREKIPAIIRARHTMAGEPIAAGPGVELDTLPGI
jgi:hypothetical protein